MSPMSLNVAWCAALLTRISIPPRWSTAFLMISRQCLASSKIAGHQHSLAAFLLDEFLDLIRLFGLVEKGDQNIGSLARIRDRDCPAYAAVSAGDDGFHSLELARALVRSLAMIGSGLHRIRRSRHRLLLGREWRFGIVDGHVGLLRVCRSTQ